MIRSALAGLLLLTGGLSAAETVPLTFTPLPAPELVMAGPAGVMIGAGGAIPKPPSSAVFAAEGQSADLPLADYIAQITWHNTNRFTVRSGVSVIPLKAVPGTSHFLPITLNLADGRKYLLAFPAAVIAQHGGETTLFYRSGSAQKGEVGGRTIWFYDTNTDGLYRPTEDGVRVGPMERVPSFAPIGEYFPAGDAIYRIEKLAEDGSELSYSRYEGPVGKLKLEAATGAAEMNLLVAGEEMGWVASSKEPEIALVPGEYRAMLGILSLPGAGRIAALMKTEEVAPVTVIAGEVTKLELGPPYTLQVEAMRNGANGFRVMTHQMRLVGRGGEQYFYFKWLNSPEVSIVSGTSVRRLGKLGLQEREYVGDIPAIPGNNPVRVVVTGTAEGIGVVKGEALLD